MKRIFTLSSLLLALAGNAATPTLDGVVNAAEGYTLLASGDNNAGWSNVNAKNLYFTTDANYFYFAAEVTASSWMSWAFIVNTKADGATSDSWARKITYNHTNKPDYTFRGNFGTAPVYSEYHTWTAGAWAGTGTNVNTAGTEAVNNITGTDQNGFIEIRVPRATLGTINTLDVQFYVTGNADDHGNFDAIPSDNVAAGWTPPESATTLSNYVSADATLPLKLLSFNAALQNDRVALSWRTTNEVNLSHFEIEQSTDAVNWKKAAIAEAKNVLAGYNYTSAISAPAAKKVFVRLKMVDNDGHYSYSQNVAIRQSGMVKFELASNPVKSVIKVNGSADAGVITVDLISLTGKKITSTKVNHSGGDLMIEMNTGNIASGMYLLNITGEGVKQVLRVVVQ